MDARWVENREAVQCGRGGCSKKRPPSMYGEGEVTARWMRAGSKIEKVKSKTCSTRPSRVVPHRSTTRARPCLTSLFGWEAVTQGDMAACDREPEKQVHNPHFFLHPIPITLGPPLARARASARACEHAHRALPGPPGPIMDGPSSWPVPGDGPFLPKDIVNSTCPTAGKRSPQVRPRAVDIGRTPSTTPGCGDG